MAEPPMRDPHDQNLDAFGFYDDLFGPEGADFDETGAPGLDKPPLPPRGGTGAAVGTREHPTGPSRGAHLALAAALVIAGSVLAGVGLSGTAPKREAAEPAHALVQRVATEAPEATPSPSATATIPMPDEVTAGLPFAEPKALTVPAIGVDAPVVDTGQAADGTPEIPPTAHPEEVGWYTSTVAPGEHGAAVMWGHLDTRTGTAVFQDLSDLKPGDTIQVARADDRVATFTVERSAVYPREAVPADAMYDDPGYPALRLVTCAGRFDTKNQEYTSNIVVFARLTSVTAPLRPVSAPPVTAPPTTTPPTAAAKARHAAHTTKGVPLPVPVPTADPRPAGSALAIPKPAKAPVPVPAAPKPQARPQSRPQPSGGPRGSATPSTPASGKPTAGPGSPAPASASAR